MLKIDTLIKKMELEEIKELPSGTFPGGYPLFYITSFGNIICPDCANEIINDEYEDIVGYEINYESEMYCQECSKAINPAYEG